MTSLAAAFVEAWQELRIHRLRVLLSLIGVGVAVCSLTLVVALGDVSQDALTADLERQSGRPDTFSAYLEPPADAAGFATMRERTAAGLEKYGISYAGFTNEGSFTVETPGGKVGVNAYGIDPPWFDMHRENLAAGRAFTAADRDNLSPALVVDELFMEKAGMDLGEIPAAITLPGGLRATVVGVRKGAPGYDTPTVLLSPEAMGRANSEPLGGMLRLEVWLPEGQGEEISGQLGRTLTRDLGQDVSFERSDYLAWGDEDPLLVIRLVLLGISGLILALGALGLINIALVTLRQRIREIGIRRSFGATASRVFFTVMMENVVGTVVAGGIGIMVAILILRSPLISDFLTQGSGVAISFPVGAAITGLLVSVAVGALAGITPAILAVKVRIVDAIRG